MAQTTVMKDSIVGDQWIAEMCKLNPVQRVLNAETNQPTGSILTGPVRLAFCDSVFEAKPQMRSDPNSKLKHSLIALFTPYSDLSIFWEEYYKVCASDFANHYNASTGQYHGLDNPLKDQAEKAQFGGFTPGCMYTTLTSNYKPAVVDIRMNPITDPSKVYAGVWAIVACNAYASGKNTPRKGPRFGLQTIMVIGDDQPLTGGAPDPRTLFKSANVKPPVGAPSAAFAASGAVQTPPQGAPVVGQQAVSAYYPGAAPAAPAYAPPAAPVSPSGDDDLSGFM